MSGTDYHGRGPGSHRDTAQNPVRMVRIRLVSTGTYIPILLTATLTTPVRGSCHANNYVRCRNMDYNRRARKMLRTTQRRMLRLIIQTRRKYKNNKNLDKDIRNDEISEDTEEKDSTHDEHDQDSISFDDDQDSTTSQEDDLDDLIEYRRSSTKEADEKCCITNLVETQKNIQWRQVLRIATQSQETWARKAARQRLKGEQEDQPKYGKTT